MIKNLTPHSIDIVGVGSIAPSGIVARCSQSEEIVGAIDGIQITKQTFGEVSGSASAS